MSWVGSATQALTPMAKAGLIDLEENMETDAS